MSIIPIELTCCGPFRWHSAANDCIFRREEAKQPGVYIWAVPYEDGFLAYYVGETGRSIAERTTEHAAAFFLGGQFRIYDPAEFAEGRKVLV